MRPHTTIAYHGSGTRIEAFDHAFCGHGNDQCGSGFYFTSHMDEAEAYCVKTLNELDKPGGTLDPTVHVCEITFKNIIGEKEEIRFPKDKVKAILLASPTLHDDLTNFGDIESEGFDRVLKEAVDAYSWSGLQPAIKVFNNLSNDFFRGNEGAFLKAVTEVYGIDGVIAEFDNGKTHVVAWHPEQIKIIRTYEPDDASPHYGTYLFHGTSAEYAKDIVENGIDIEKCTKGYFGQGFYTASRYKLALGNYADFSDDEGAVIRLMVNERARILDTRNPEHAEQIGRLSAYYEHNDLAQIATDMGIDGLYDASFGGVVIYNPDAVNIIGLVEPEIKKQGGLKP